jgi:hypothetical protein
MLRNHIVARHHLQNTAIEARDISMVMAVGSSGSIGNADLALQVPWLCPGPRQ